MACGDSRILLPTQHEQPSEAAVMRTSSEARLSQRLDGLCCVVRLTHEKHFFWEMCLVRLEGVTRMWWAALFHLSLPHPVKWNCDSGRCNVQLQNSFWFRLPFLSSVSYVEQFSLYQWMPGFPVHLCSVHTQSFLFDFLSAFCPFSYSDLTFCYTWQKTSF